MMFAGSLGLTLKNRFTLFTMIDKLFLVTSADFILVCGFVRAKVAIQSVWVQIVPASSK